MDIEIIGVPIYFGADRPGVELAPDAFRSKNILTRLQGHGHRIIDGGNIAVRKVSHSEKNLSHSKVKFIDPIIETNISLADKVYHSMRNNHFPLVIGGDHSLGLGSISGFSKYCMQDRGCKEIAVIWIDAHGDINTFESSPTGNIHGMPLAAAMGIGDGTLVNLYYNGVKVRPENVYLIGPRDLDQGELKLIERLKLKLWTTGEIHNIGVREFTSELCSELLRKNLKIHLSFDIDCLDADLVPGTNTPVEEGLTVQEVTHILSSIMSTNLVKAMDFVEFNTLFDVEGKTMNTSLELLEMIPASLI